LGPRAGDGRLTLGFRAEDVHIGVRGAAAALVHDVENHGVEKVVTLKAAQHLIRATVPATVPIHLDQKVRFSLNEERLHGFNAVTGKNLV
ncbi:MAG: ABC transporter ATP-binding protein, partial [Limisphaerales bacterium]